MPVLAVMKQFLNREIEKLDLEARAFRVMVPWKKEFWTYGEIMAYRSSQEAQIACERLWHLREELNMLLTRKRVTERCNLSVSSVLSATWDSQTPGEA